MIQQVDVADAVFDEPEMTMRDYWRVVVRRRWLLATAVAATLAGSLAMVATQRPVYQAEAQMLVRSANSDSVFQNQSASNANAARLVETEIRVLEGTIVRDRVIADLGIEGRIPAVDGSAIGQTDVVAVRVRSHDPVTAARLADAYVQAYIDTRREQNVNGLLDAAAEVQRKINEIQAQIDDLNGRVAAAPESERPAVEQEVSTQLRLLVDQQAVFKQRLDQLQVDASVQSGSAQVVRPAEVPSEQSDPNPLRTAVLALIVGLLIGLGAAFLADYLDDSVNTVDELQRAAVGYPVIGTLPDDHPPDDRPIALSVPRDRAVEAYRGLRTALQFMMMDGDVTTVQVTSPLPGDGKTTTAANVAVLFVQADKRVVLVDADLRKPRVHQMFGLDAHTGLTDWLLDPSLAMPTQQVPVGDAWLDVVTAGTLPPNPSELLGSEGMRVLLAELRRSHDVVIIDAPPVLPVTDAVVLSGLTDALVLVARAHRTTHRQVREATELLRRAGATRGGAVLNKVVASIARGGYGGGYGYGGRYGYGGYDAVGDSPSRRGRSKKARQSETVS